MPNIGDYVNYGNQGVCRIDGRQYSIFSVGKFLHGMRL